jgi:hypothetical protein
MAKSRSPEGEAQVKRVNSRIGLTCLPVFALIAAARAVQGLSTLLAWVFLGIGACIWVYVMTLVFSKRRIK